MKERTIIRYRKGFYFTLIGVLFFQCQNTPVETDPLFLPEGFESKVFVDKISETTRHIVVSPQGTVYTKFKKTSKEYRNLLWS